MSSQDFSPKAPTTPAYLLVQVPGHEHEDLDILIYGQRNGKVGRVLQLTTGKWEVSVSVPGAPVEVIELRHTTISRPKVVVFNNL